MAGALIVTAELGPAGPRVARSPATHPLPGRAQPLPAHLTMFHALPPSAEGELRVAPVETCPGRAPRRLDRGPDGPRRRRRLRIVSPDLDAIRNELAERLSRIARRAGRGRLAARTSPSRTRSRRRSLVRLLAGDRARFRAAAARNSEARPAPLSGRSVGRIGDLSVPRDAS